VRVLGIDLAASAKNTGAVAIHPVGLGKWQATELDRPADDDALVDAARHVDFIGVDCPLGWPTAFVDSIMAHQEFQPWSWPVGRETLTHRDTDRAVRALGAGTPMSVSADRLGSVAMRCALLQQRWGNEVWSQPGPRDGSGPLLEVYPAAALRAWHVPSNGYKNRQDAAAALAVRELVVAHLVAVVGEWLDISPLRAKCATSDHVLDALVCALIALAAKAGMTHQPPDEHRQAALVEGWIHVPSAPLDTLFPISLDG
jgi:predicted nuclease with RNAse H fold